MLSCKQAFDLALDGLAPGGAAWPFAGTRGFQIFKQASGLAREVHAEKGDVTFEGSRSRQ